MTPEEVGRALDVSRETLARLEAYAALLAKWQKAINLVAPATLPHIWRRHILDSGQLARLAPLDALWLDLGSGAGFPGLVIAILGARRVRLVESDARKCAFLREAARITSAPAEVVNARIAEVAPFPADVVTARALAPLSKLLGFAAPFLAPSSVALFPKGQDVEAELTEAHRNWRMRVERHPSLTDGRAAILRLTEVEHV
jgi:16S rRNA (guanine527-N7)-methyltransferase